MEIEIHILNFKDIPIDKLLGYQYLSIKDKKSFDGISNIDVKKEKIVSSIFKNKYIGDYYLNEKGKPLNKDKYFNISHSYGLIAFVMDDVQIGIDIEKIRNVKEDLIEYISNKDEKKYIKDEKTFFEIWTNKEALLKAHGSGISSRMKDIPALPINGIRNYENKTFMNKTIKYQDYIITICRETNKKYSLKIIDEIL